MEGFHIINRDLAAQFLYIGNFCSDGSKECGIGIYRYHPEKGDTELLNVVREDIVSGAMFIDEKRGILFTVDERKDNPDLGGKGGGRVFSFAIDKKTGALTEISRQSSFGSMPSYITPDKTGKYLLACHFSSNDWCTKVRRDADGAYHLDIVQSDSTLVLYPVDDAGVIGEPCDVLVFPEEKGGNACLHYVQVSPDGNYFALGVRNHGKMHFLRLDYEQEKLLLCNHQEYPRGNGPRSGHSPRYGVFHPTKPFFYFNSEYMTNLTTIRYDDHGGLETLAVQDVRPQLPGAADVKASMSDLCISRDGNFIYALYRGVNAICVFRIGDDGLPQMIQSLALAGDGPRGLRISPDGRFILVADLASRQLETLAVHGDGTVELAGIADGLWGETAYRHSTRNFSSVRGVFSRRYFVV